ncbi:MAG TPA: phytanoyl-CoA dioxygenase family protein [Limnochordia bacterium]|nr:phytanoyl-CoA dioxygenase family protein [Limnochordia bacterium]
MPLARDTVAPLAAGGLLLFDGLIHHGTPPNRSALGRRSLQFHYVPADTPAIPDEARLAVFGGEGQGVTC